MSDAFPDRPQDRPRPGAINVHPRDCGPSRKEQAKQQAKQQVRQAADEGGRALLASRMRAQVLPWAAAAGCYTAAALAAGPAGWGALAGGAGAAGIAAAVGTWRTRGEPWFWRVYPSAAAVAAGGWQAAAFLHGAPASLAGALAAGAAALALPFWRRNAPAFPDTQAEALAELEPPETEPEPEVVPWQIQRFHQHLSAPAKPLAGTWATDVALIPYGFELVVNWPQGRTHDELWEPAPRRVLRSIFDVPAERISVETLPGRPQGKARLTVLTSDPLQAGVTWDGPHLDEGVTTIGCYADGRPVPWEFWNHEGACHGVICGCSGSGKSKLLAILMLTTMRADWMVPWFLDGQHGASSPTLGHYTERIGRGPEDSLARLRQLKAILDDRSARMPHMTWTDGKGRPRRGVSKIVPSPRLPQIVVFLDEAQDILAHDEAAAIVSQIVAQGRKTGIALILLTQVPSTGNLNSLTGMREQLKAFNKVVLRLTERFTTGMVDASELPLPPHKLPKRFDDGTPTNGLGFKPDDRDVLMRAAFVPDDDELDWAHTHIDTPLEPEAIRAAERGTGRQAGPPSTAVPPAPASGAISVITQAQQRIAALHTNN